MELVFRCDVLVDPVDSLLLLRLAYRVNEKIDVEHCFCSMTELAQACRRNVRTVERRLTRLEADGWLRSKRSGGRGKAPDFWINRSKLEAEFKKPNPDAHDVGVSPSKNHDIQSVEVSEENYDAHDVEVSNENPDMEDAKPRHLASETTTFRPENPDTQMSPQREQRKKPTEASFLQAVPAIEKSDPRHVQFQEAYCVWFERVNGITPSWNGREGRALKEFLAAHPALTFQQWTCILDNRAASPCNTGKPLHTWISLAECWSSGVADDLGNTPRRGWVDRSRAVEDAIRSRASARASDPEFSGGVGLADLILAQHERNHAPESELGNNRAGLPAPRRE